MQTGTAMRTDLKEERDQILKLLGQMNRVMASTAADDREMGFIDGMYDMLKALINDLPIHLPPRQPRVETAIQMYDLNYRD